MPQPGRQTLCLFSSYYPAGEIPYYVRHYLGALCKLTSKVVYVSNEKTLPPDSLQFLHDNQIECLFVKNEGYDFGMWAKALEHFPPEAYERLILVNDSCILTGSLEGSLEQIKKHQWDYAGLLASEEISYHIQSYFLVLSPAGFAPFLVYLREHGIPASIREVIHTYEVGLTAYMQKAGLQTGAVFGSGLRGKITNPVYSDIGLLLKKGFPLIKKKMLFDTFSTGERMTLMRRGVKTGSDYYFRLLAALEEVQNGSLSLTALKEDKKRYAHPVLAYFQRMYVSIYGLLRKLK